MKYSGQSKIIGIGAYLPPRKVTSIELMEESGCRRFGVPVDYITRHIGIVERRVSDEHQLPSDMAILASEIALKDAGIEAADIDLIIYCGIDRDWQEPATAHRVQCELGAINSTCFDVSNACHGIMTGLSIANAMIQSTSANTVLLCTGEKPSQVLYSALAQLRSVKNKDEFKGCIGALTVGDAGGALLVQRSENEQGLKWMQTLSDGTQAKLCY